MQSVGAALAQLQRNTYLRQVRLPERIGEVHLLAAEAAELDEYRAVVGIHRRYREQVVSPTWARVAAMGQRALPLPARADGEGELWIRLAAEVLRSGV